MNILTTNTPHCSFTCDECGRDFTTILRLGYEMPSWSDKTDNYFYLCSKCAQNIHDMVESGELRSA